MTRSSDIAWSSISHADFAAACDATEVPRAACSEGTGGAEGVLHKLHVADLVTRHLGEQREGRRNFLSKRASFVCEASEHCDGGIICDHVTDLERFGLPYAGDAVKDVNNALWAAVGA